MGFPCGSAGKESACNAGNLGSVPGLGRSPGDGKGYRLQYSGLEYSMDCIAHGVKKSLDMTERLSLSLRLLIIYIVIIYIILFGNNIYCVHTQSCSTLCSCLRESLVRGQTYSVVSPQPQLYSVNRCS